MIPLATCYILLHKLESRDWSRVDLPRSRTEWDMDRYATVATVASGQQRLKADHVELLHVAMPTASEARSDSTTPQQQRLKMVWNIRVCTENISELSGLFTCVTHTHTMPWFYQHVCSTCESCKVKLVSLLGRWQSCRRASTRRWRHVMKTRIVNIVMSLEMSVWVPVISSIASQEEALRDVERRHSFEKCSWLVQNYQNLKGCK